MTLKKVCPCCGRNVKMRDVDDSKMFLWQIRFANIQDIFPEMNPMEREFIITGYCPECQKKFYKTQYTSELIEVEEVSA